MSRLVADLVDSRRHEILRAYERRLAEPAGEDRRQVQPTGALPQPAWPRDLAAAVLDDLCRVLGAAEQPAADPVSEPAVDDSRGRPEVMRAAMVLFDEAVRAVADGLPAHLDPRPALTAVATAAHEAIVARLISATDGYAGYLLDRLHRSHVDERRRVARELHDLIAHSVAVVLQDMELFALHRERDAARAEAKLDAALRSLRETLDMLRAITQDLRRSAAESGLTAALRSYVDAACATERTDLRVVGDERRVPPAVHGELFLVLREALHNAYRHSAATTIRVHVDIDADVVRAVVADDGHGFDPAQSGGRTAGTGLASMRERVALLGGTIDVRSAPGDGTVVAVEVPLVGAWNDAEG